MLSTEAKVAICNIPVDCWSCSCMLSVAVEDIHEHRSTEAESRNNREEPRRVLRLKLPTTFICQLLQLESPGPWCVLVSLRFMLANPSVVVQCGGR